MTDPLDLSLDLLRRLPPSKVEQNLESIVKLIPSYADDLYSSVDQPLKVKLDESKQGASREFLCCDYNKDGNSWRSWISDTYHPPIPPGADDTVDGESGTRPSAPLRSLELKANDAFETYARLYYDNALSSVYLWDLDSDPSSLPGATVGGIHAPSAFAGVVLLKKTIGQDRGNGISGAWDSIHVFEATERASGGSKSSSSGTGISASYKLTSTVMLSLIRRDESTEEPTDIQSSSAKVGTVEIAGSLTRQSEADYALPDFVSHVSNVGRMIEDMEAKMRNQLQEVYFGKTRDVVSHLRSTQSLEKERRARDLQKELMGLWKK
ncbi:putative F-actin-capping protein subunit beta [Mycosarcoma maydis]|uniref:F-actin-capping protein subunit beta n=1 Tax=Mycosarcoma maydis TaxID=5270 RepID=A0A0D1CI30_MYCMD|nr:putative F-actin-capping protein subunit beta [Ustilago maydis 521]KIS66593.1 putative F-actin-capping protein subunit beta [Ustilago maydis 521]|eukprot:XP_011391944.1 putative F-actin-capping protein subunit beta [Ustilago maydis 521]